MIAVKEYDVRLERQHDYAYGVTPRPVAMDREEVAEISLKVLASGKDLAKFLTMLETITGQRPHQHDHGAPALGSAAVEVA